MSTAHTRGDLLSSRGVVVITDSHSFVGDGGLKGVPIKNSSGSELISAAGDLKTENVGGMRIPYTFKFRASDTRAAAAIPVAGNVTVTKVVLPRAGSLIGIAIYSQTKLAAGHITVTAYVGATASTVIKLAMTTNANTHGGYVSQNKDVHSFAAGKTLELYLRSVTATTTTVVGQLFVEF